MSSELIQVCIQVYLKFIYSEKATKFCEIFNLLLTVCTVVKSKVKIFQNFVAFSEYMNFIFNIPLRSRKTKSIPQGPRGIYLFTHLKNIKIKSLNSSLKSEALNWATMGCYFKNIRMKTRVANFRGL